MPNARGRSVPPPAMKFSVGDGEPVEARLALDERRRAGQSVPPPVAEARAPFAWRLVVEGALEDALHGPDWAW